MAQQVRQQTAKVPQQARRRSPRWLSLFPMKVMALRAQHLPAVAVPVTWKMFQACLHQCKSFYESSPQIRTNWLQPTRHPCRDQRHFLHRSRTRTWAIMSTTRSQKQPKKTWSRLLSISVSQSKLTSIPRHLSSRLWPRPLVIRSQTLHRC